MLHKKRNFQEFSSSYNHSISDAIELLWGHLRDGQLANCEFYREKVVMNLTADFYCPKENLIIELFCLGNNHSTNDNNIEKQIRYAYLNKLGFKILRFSDIDIFTQLEQVLEQIYQQLA
jgi:very-short-patch-repair endonuclease